MDAATQPRSAASTGAMLAGLQGGMVGALWMLGWFGLSDAWQRRSFWTSENLFASAFYGSAAIRRGFSGSTFAGLALYLLIYSSLGALIALTLRHEARTARIVLVCLFAPLLWYYATYQWLWKIGMPMVALLHPERPTILGHLIYGVWLSRFRLYLPGRTPETETAALMQSPHQSASPTDPVSQSGSSESDPHEQAPS
jgi:hypothetical protein